jgi:serine protease AprX
VAIPIPRTLVEFILLGPTDDRRQLQDSPILGDVWIEFARQPDEAVDLLITPFRLQAAGHVCIAIDEAVEYKDAHIAYLQGIVAVTLPFKELLRVVVPMTQWWSEKRIRNGVAAYAADAQKMVDDIDELLEAARAWYAKRKNIGMRMRDKPAFNRYVTLAGLILWASEQTTTKRESAPSSDGADEILTRVNGNELAGPLGDLFARIRDDAATKSKENAAKNLVWHVSRNRTAFPALDKSVAAVKADAARTLFRVDCSEILWAVVDSGIDGTHGAFKKKDGVSCRIKKSFDFSNIREIVSIDNRNEEKRKARIAALSRRTDLLRKLDPVDADKRLKELAQDAAKGRPIDWESVEPFVQINPGTKPPSNHGTHVAGIIGASKDAATAADEKAREAMRKRAAVAPENAGNQDASSKPADGDADSDEEKTDFADGMCPDIGLYDFRVLAPNIPDTEFAIIAALQYIRHVNERNSFITIHGVNLSLSIPHDVRNFACGRTPVCNECERLIESGVVVVAAAGNHGYQSFETNEGAYEGYVAFSVTDPGNADGVITVGATHRYWPHTYGISFFSSRGPTGDGRPKPDLVAPGERIRAPLPDNEWGDLDGTSMAAPHVSGAAAMLMARSSEVIGQPRRIKRILCESATDLGRERSFQGHGMLDVLRAFQSF